MFPPPDWPQFPLEPTIRLRITRDMPPLSVITEAAVSALWATALAVRPLFNGRVFCVDEIEPGELRGHWTEYRRLTAQIAEPRLFDALRIRSLAVCGVLAGPGGVAVGRREARSAYQAGLWQLAPAGSVDHGAAEPGGASWQAAIRAELREELGLEPADVSAMRVLGLVQHPTGVLDMGILVRTPLHAPAVLQRHAARGNGEYDRMMVVPADSIATRVQERGGTLVSSVSPFLAWAGLHG